MRHSATHWSRTIAIGLLIPANPRDFTAAYFSFLFRVGDRPMKYPTEAVQAHCGAVKHGAVWKILQEACTMHLATPGTLQRG